MTINNGLISLSIIFVHIHFIKQIGKRTLHVIDFISIYRNIKIRLHHLSLATSVRDLKNLTRKCVAIFLP